jgi:NADP-dependent 3-hydroxy acid dehydrogenase YdfG
MDRFRGKVALVTGASSGIGRAVSKLFAQEGMRVVVSARRKERLEDLVRECEGDEGEIAAVPCDLRDPASIAGLFRSARDRWGGVNVLVNNAGLGQVAPLMSGETEAWREMLEVNVLALCICTREAVQDMRAAGDDGHVIHISSMAAHRVPPNSGVYSATKFAVRSLTESLRQELRAAGSKIRVSAISPGFVETEFAEHYHQSRAVAQEVYGRYRVLQPEDLAETVRYVLSAPPHMQVHDVLIRPTDQPS